jgi:hypothetical protein
VASFGNSPLLLFQPTEIICGLSALIADTAPFTGSKDDEIYNFKVKSSKKYELQN